MDGHPFLEFAIKMTKLRMFPTFEIVHYILMCLAVREDMHLNHPMAVGANHFHRRHPLATWISSMLLCFGGNIVTNFLLGEPLIMPFTEHHNVIVASIVWYLMFYSPFDIVFGISKMLPFRIILFGFKEVQRAFVVNEAVLNTAILYPNAYLVIVVMGTVRGSGNSMMKNFERLVRGVWIPTSNEILHPSLTTKSCIVASTIILMQQQNYIQAPHPLIFLGVIVFFMYLRLTSLLLDIHDPFIPFENQFCAVFMGGFLGALRNALSQDQLPRRNRDDGI